MARRLVAVALGMRDKVPADAERETEEGSVDQAEGSPKILSRAERKEVVSCGNSGRS